MSMGIRRRNIANGWTKHSTHDFFKLIPRVVVIIPILKLANMYMPTAT